MDIFQEVKSKVSMFDLITQYGITAENSGKQLFCKCLFHQERTASMAIYENGFKCYGCNTSGDIIAFVSQYFSLSNIEAVQKINADLRLGINLDKPSSREIRKKKQDSQLLKGLLIWRDQKYNTLSAYHRVLHSVIRDLPSLADKDTFLYYDFFGYYLDLLLTNDIGQLLNLYKSPELQRW